MSPKNILLFTRPLVPPWDEGSKNLAFEIARHSDGDFVFHLLSDTSEKLAQEKWKNEEKIVIEKIFSSGKMDFKAKMALLRKLFFSNLENLDIIHFLFSPRLLTSNLFRWRLKNTKIKTIQTLATLNTIENYPREKIKKILFADLIVVQSNFTYKKLKQLNIPSKIIYPGIDLDKFKPQPKDKKLMQELNLKEKDFILLFTGEYDRLEAIDDILEAFQILQKNNQINNLKIILACRLKTKRDYQIKKATQDKIAHQNWQNYFVFLDFAKEIVKLYNLAELNIFPVRKMTGKFDIPLVLIESMACGKTTLVSDLPMLTEFIQDKKNGLIIPTANPKILAEKITWLRNRPEVNQQLGQMGRLTTQELFDIKKIAQEYQKIYSSLFSFKNKIS